jgi:hypothetical protein
MGIATLSVPQKIGFHKGVLLIFSHFIGLLRVDFCVIEAVIFPQPIEQFCFGIGRPEE